MSSVAVELKMTVAEELAYLAEQNGGTVRPIDVVNYARDPETALHGQFTWDDGDAAQQWRLQQARQVLKIYVKVTESLDSETNIRLFVSLPKDRADGTGYRPLIKVMKNKRQRAELLNLALSELRAFRHNRRYKLLTELQPVWDAIDSVL